MTILTWQLEVLIIDWLYPEAKAPRTLYYWVNLPTASRADFAWANAISEWATAGAAAGLIVLLVGLASRNHRFAERPSGTAARQLPWLVAYVCAAAVLTRGIGRLTFWLLATR